MRTHVFVFAVVIALCGIGAASWAQATETSRPIEGPAEYLDYVDVPFILLPPGSFGKPYEQAVISVTLAVPPAKAKEVKKQSGRLSEAFAEDIRDALKSELRATLLQGETLDVAGIKERMYGVAETVVGPGVVRNIVVQVTQGRV